MFANFATAITSGTAVTLALLYVMNLLIGIQFDVLASGSVSNFRIVESSASAFENAARKAAARFRCKPRIVHGVAIKTTGVQNLFRFQMEH